MKKVTLKLSKHLYAFALTLLIAGTLSTTTQAQNFIVDSIFGSNGILIEDLQSSPNTMVKMLPIQDSKFVVVGNTEDTNTLRKSIDIMLINTCGVREYAFGSNGYLSIRNGFSNYVKDVILDRDDQLVFCGGQDDSRFLNATVGIVYRLDQKGKPDKTFGTLGKVEFEIPRSSIKLEKIHQLNDGAYMLSGSSAATISGGLKGFVLIKLQNNGSLDYSFGIDGVIHYETPTLIATNSIVTPDNSIILLGMTDTVDAKLLMLKLDFQGNPNMTFGNDGLKSHSTIYSPELAKLNVELMNSGSSFLVVGQRRKDSKLYIQINRFTLDGELDLSFGIRGVKYISAGHKAKVYGMNISSNSIYVSGSSDIHGGKALIARMNLDGKSDESFGTNGLRFIDFNNYPTFQRITNVIYRGDDKIFIAGSDQDYLLARLTTKSNVPNLTLQNNILSSSAIGTYHWFMNGHLLDQFNGPTFQPRWKGAYQVMVSDWEGCRFLSRPYYIFEPIGLLDDVARIYQESPFDNFITIAFQNPDKISVTNLNIQIFNLEGKLIKQENNVTLSGTSRYDVSDLDTGAYIIRLISDEFEWSSKMIKYIN